MSFKINLGSWGSVFAVPTDIVDKHIKLANSTQIKTLLWILRNNHKEFDIKEISKALSKQEEDIVDSLQYWVENNILVKDSQVLSPANACKGDVAQKNVATLKENKNTTQQKVSTRVLSRRQRPDSVYLSQRMKGSEEITSLMQECEIILGRPLSTPDCTTLLMLMETDGLPADVILMLVQHAVSCNKANMKYIEKIGIKWGEEEINSVQRAEKKLISIANDEKNWKKILKITGIEYHSQTEKEKIFVNRWLNEWCFKDEMIREAYERCVDNTGKFTFSYANKILEKWYKNGINSLEQANVEEMKKIQNNKKKTKQSTASYDIEEYEKYDMFAELD